MATELRRERRERQKRQRQRQQHRRASTGGIGRQLVIAGVIAGAAALAFLGLGAAGVFSPAAAIDINSAEFQLAPGTTIGQQQTLQSQAHIPVGQKASYNTDPPTSGEHWAQTGVAPTTWGIKDATQPKEVTTHNLEHGGIVIAYANLSPAETDRLRNTVRALMNGAFRKIILEPYPMTDDTKVALTSWGWMLKLQTVDQIQIVQFVRAHHADPNFAPEWNVP